MMNGKIVGGLISFAVVLMAFSGWLGGVSFAQAHDPLVMVVNKSNATASIEKPEAKKLLLGSTSTWPNGKKVVVVLSPLGSADRAALMRSILGMTQAEFTRYEMQAMFTGREAVATQEEPSAAAIKAFVKANPAALGFVHESEVDKDLKSVMTVP
jgi:ABC-type phosphate transport system substrate-binding protein